MDRRGFLSGIIALAVAPAIVRAGSLMPIKPVWSRGAARSYDGSNWGYDARDALRYSMTLNGRAFEVMPTADLPIIGGGLGLTPGDVISITFDGRATAFRIIGSSGPSA